MLKKILILVALLTIFSIIQAQITGRVVGVHDGDSFTLLDNDKRQYKIRLHGIDCPELKQDFGNAAKRFTSNLIFNTFVKVVTNGKDRYGRIIGLVHTQDGLILNEELLKAGMAWHFKKYDQTSKWSEFEISARKSKIGLWSQPNPVPPWDWRNNKTKWKRTGLMPVF